MINLPIFIDTSLLGNNVKIKYRLDKQFMPGFLLVTNFPFRRILQLMIYRHMAFTWYLTGQLYSRPTVFEIT
jgi:hypothetical protein